MDRVSVLGLGNWGTALANHLAGKGMPVLGWTLHAEVVEGINRTHRNPHYLTEVDLSPNLSATGDLDEALRAAIIVLAIPSAALGDVVSKLVGTQATSIWVSAIKGLEEASLSTPLQYCSQRLPVPGKLVVLSGPSFARDVVRHKPAGVVAASVDEDAARIVGEIFRSETLRVYLSDDPLGVELGGIVKNVIALAVGVVDGVGLGDSARAGLITRGLAEMMRLAHAMGAKVQTLSGLSGLGDLVMTATCDTSRNRTVGLRLGRGESLPHILETLGSVAEGVRTTPLVLQLAKRHGVEMPISEHVALLLAGETTPQEMIHRLITRPMKHEFEGI